MREIKSAKRTCYCGEVNEKHVGNTVVLKGWVNRIRDHGGVRFIEMRDRSGIVQIVSNPKFSKEAHKRVQELANEYVIAVRGPVKLRDADNVNPNIPTGKIEVEAHELDILNTCAPLPFHIDDANVNEELRMKYRYYDFRRPEMFKILNCRHKVKTAIRKYMDEQGFLEIETPILGKSTPEGARDYLVPSRVFPGKFFALPQSPQLFKQMSMVGGIDKYFQIARCFRDEDLRKDRLAEFTQLDIEMSFVEPEDIFAVVEGMMKAAFQVIGVDVPTPFPRMPYSEVMLKYGIDKPDLRYGLEIVDFTDVLKNVQVTVFQKVFSAGGCVRGIKVPEAEKYIKGDDVKHLEKFIYKHGAKGLAELRVVDGDLKKTVAKFFTEEEKKGVIKKFDAKNGDLILAVAGDEKTTAEALGQLRIELATNYMNLIPQGIFKFLWVVDFPMFEYSETEKRYKAMHHPFTAPKDEYLETLLTEPEKALAKQYDCVLNGVELGGGSIRIHNRETQQKVFKVLSLEEHEVNIKFKFLLNCLQYGAPPHGGLAVGLDRLLMIMLNTDSIREVIPFPSNTKNYSPLLESPSEVGQDQLEELFIKIDEQRIAELGLNIEKTEESGETDS